MISFVADRLGHERRYAIDAVWIREVLGDELCEIFEIGILKNDFLVRRVIVVS